VRITAAAFNASLLNYPPNDHSLEYSLSVEQVDSIVHKLQLGKAASLEKLTVKHIKYGHHCIILIITKIFNLLLPYEYVPAALGKNLNFPIPKSYRPTSKYEDKTITNRGISVGSIVFKVFEHCLLLKFGDL